jgi:hypothetical protein
MFVKLAIVVVKPHQTSLSRMKKGSKLYLVYLVYCNLKWFQKNVEPNTLKAPDFWQIMVNNIRLTAFLLLGHCCLAVQRL